MSLPRLNPVEPPWYGPVCPVVGEGWHREVPPYPDLRRIRDIGSQSGDGPLATLLSYSDRDSGGQVWVNRFGSRPLKKRLVKATDQSVSILICSSDGCQLQGPQKEAIAY